MIRSYSLKIDGEMQLSANFKVKEFACKDGSDGILIADELVWLLQALRTRCRRRVRIGSGFRTRAYNNRIGGAINSRHMTGEAADIDVVNSDGSVMDPLLVAMIAQALGSRSVGCYRYADGQSWVHVGSAATDKYWLQPAPNDQHYIPTFLPVLSRGSDGEFVLQLQKLLKAHGIYAGALDGEFGPKTLAAVKAYQKQNALVIDGKVGPRTWADILLKGDI